MGIIVNEITPEELEVAMVTLNQPLGQVDTICEHIRLIYAATKILEKECVALTVYSRRVDAMAQKLYQKDFKI
jgi:hypothetical protein